MAKILFYLFLVICTYSARTLADPSILKTRTTIRHLGYDTDKQEFLYVCFFGFKRTDIVLCSDTNEQTWSDPIDAELKLRCPKNGSAEPIGHGIVYFSASTNDVSCEITDGEIGLGHMEITVKAKQTRLLNYYSIFYKDS